MSKDNIPEISTSPITNVFRQYNADHTGVSIRNQSGLAINQNKVNIVEEKEIKEEVPVASWRDIPTMLHRYQRKLKLTDENMIQAISRYLNDIGEYKITEGE